MAKIHRRTVPFLVRVRLNRHTVVGLAFGTRHAGSAKHLSAGFLVRPTSKETEYVGSMNGLIRRRRCTAAKGQPTLDAWSTAGGAILHGRDANDGGLTSDRAWKGMGVVAVTADLAQLLDKEWEDRSLAEILKAPVSALQGVSEGDADLLRQAFNIKTVGDLGKNKYFQAAQALTVLGETGAK